MTRRPHHRYSDPPGSIHYNGNGDTHRIVTWGLGIASVIISASIIAGATALYNMNAQMAVFAYRLQQIERSIQ